MTIMLILLAIKAKITFLKFNAESFAWIYDFSQRFFPTYLEFLTFLKQFIQSKITDNFANESFMLVAAFNFVGWQCLFVGILERVEYNAKACYQSLLFRSRRRERRHRRKRIRSVGECSSARRRRSRRTVCYLRGWAWAHRRFRPSSLLPAPSLEEETQIVCGTTGGLCYVFF